MPKAESIEKKAINTIRFLSADAVQRANSGHPGMPMGSATIAYTLWKRHLRFNPKNPEWVDRDRFVLSGGHGSMLLYSLLHLTGFDLSLEDIKEFRQWGSPTAGHPECHLTPGVEVTTGPLGQGFGNAVGMAIAEKHLAAVFNKDEHPIVDHYTYVLATDGDMMEGISSEGGSIAGHLKLGKLIVLYDDNNISIDGSTDLAFTENVQKRFEAFGWHVQTVENGNDIDAIDAAIKKAKKDPRPSLIACQTHIGYGMPTKQDTAKAHGEPPGEEELEGAKKNLGWPLEPRFYVPEDVLEHFREAVSRGEELEKEWKAQIEKYAEKYPDLADQFERQMKGELPDGWEADLPSYSKDHQNLATRVPSGHVINAVAPHIPELIGGSADLTPSNKTWIDESTALQADSPEGRNIHFGVREHVMAAIVNGMAAHGGVKPFGATFLIFSDYMRPAIRLSALSRHNSLWIFTHDSIGLGEDGPTHQPVEQLASLRAIPNLVVIRPCDANEVVEAWKIGLKRKEGPTAFAFTRQKVPIISRDKYAEAEGLQKGAYVLADLGKGNPELLLMASGSEVHLIVEAGEQLAMEGINVRLVSFPSWELFEKQDETYRNTVLPQDLTPRLAVEAGASMGWERWVGDKGDIIGVDKFGSSAPYKDIFDNYGLTVENVVARAKALLEKQQ